jgi:peptidoglycan hydrolase-like protein with peptidoglycan-binding domain
MKDKQHRLAAAIIAANLAVGASAGFAQILPGPSGEKFRLERLQQTKPTTQSQVAQGLPGPGPLAGQRGTIPERMPSPDSGSQQQMVISSEEIRRAQEALKAKGFDPGAISGRMDARTQEALRKFQTANDLQATGILDHKTADKLGIKLRGDKNSTSQQRQKSTKPKAPSDLQLR